MSWIDSLQEHIEALYHTYSDDIYRFILSICGNSEGANDILQNTYIQAIINIGRFRKESSVKTWLFAIAKNECHKYHKSKMNYIAFQDVQVAAPSPVENQIIQKQECEAVLRCINSLDSERRMLMILRLVNELSFSEIGSILQRSDTWARVTFMRTRKLITDMMKEDQSR